MPDHRQFESVSSLEFKKLSFNSSKLVLELQFHGHQCLPLCLVLCAECRVCLQAWRDFGGKYRQASGELLDPCRHFQPLATLRKDLIVKSRVDRLGWLVAGQVRIPCKLVGHFNNDWQGGGITIKMELRLWRQQKWRKDFLEFKSLCHHWFCAPGSGK